MGLEVHKETGNSFGESVLFYHEKERLEILTDILLTSSKHERTVIFVEELLDAWTIWKQLSMMGMSVADITLQQEQHVDVTDSLFKFNKGSSTVLILFGSSSHHLDIWYATKAIIYEGPSDTYEEL